MADIRSMIGKEVEVIANGMRYKGVLIEVSDMDVHIKTANQWVALPVSSVSDVRPADSVRRTLEPYHEDTPAD